MRQKRHHDDVSSASDAELTDATPPSQARPDAAKTEAERKRQREKKQKYRENAKLKGTDRVSLEKKVKSLQEQVDGLTAANPDVARLKEEVKEKDDALALARANAARNKVIVPTAAMLELTTVTAKVSLGHVVDVSAFELPPHSPDDVTLEKHTTDAAHMMTFKFPRATVNVFRNGTVVVLHAPDEMQAFQAVVKAMDLIGSTATWVQVMQTFKVTSREAHYKPARQIHMDKLHVAIRAAGWMQPRYDPEICSGMRIHYVPGVRNVTVQVYQKTGTMQVTGTEGASFANMVVAFRKVFELVDWSWTPTQPQQ